MGRRAIFSSSMAATLRPSQIAPSLPAETSARYFLIASPKVCSGTSPARMASRSPSIRAAHACAAPFVAKVPVL